MELNDIVIPAASAASGGVTVGWIAKLLIQNFLKKNDENHSKWGERIQDILITLTRIEEQIKGLQKFEETVRGMAREQDKSLVVITTHMDKLKADVNNMGHKLRTLAATGG